MYRYLKAVGWSFLGLREKYACGTGLKKFRPIFLVAVDILACVVFVVGLPGVVQIVVFNRQ